MHTSLSPFVTRGVFAMLILHLFSGLRAELSLARVFQDHMVLQREMPVPVWGTADPETTLTVHFGEQQATGTADAEGNWQVTLRPLTASKNPSALSVTAGSETLTITDVLVGEVWLCSGQSNMEFPVKLTRDAEAELTAADYPDMRYLLILRQTADSPTETFRGEWKVCTPESVKPLSAVGYFFGRELQRELDVPLGLISASWGGTRCEAWTRHQALKDNPLFDAILERREEWEKHPEQVERLVREEAAAIPVWMEKARTLMNTPPKPAAAVFDPVIPLAEAEARAVPGKWKEHTDGLALYRKVVEIQEDDAGKPATLELGQIMDFDVTWINGTKVGHTTPDNIREQDSFRSYSVPAGVLKAGPNVILVQMGDWRWDGGFASPANRIRLNITEGSRIPLAGTWEFRIEIDLGNRPFIRTRIQDFAGTLYYGMIDPLIPYAIRGVIWYQGEANAGRAYQYRELFPTMITDWRAQWGQGDFPFYFVQLANYRARNPEPVEDTWAELREAQLLALSLPNTGMAVTIDIGNPKDIHPTNKQDVGYRLAQWALSETYGQERVYSGPLFREMEIKGSEVTLSFDHVGDGLKTSDGGDPEGFALAGADRTFVWADAQIVGDRVQVSSPAIPAPVAVRYGWSINPPATLVNTLDLPASPFRTDDWPGITVDKR